MLLELRMLGGVYFTNISYATLRKQKSSYTEHTARGVDALLRHDRVRYPGPRPGIGQLSGLHRNNPIPWLRRGHDISSRLSWAIAHIPLLNKTSPSPLVIRIYHCYRGNHIFFAFSYHVFRIRKVVLLEHQLELSNQLTAIFRFGTVEDIRC